jgi:hypothetical protein
MHEQLRFNIWSSLVLSLILFATNVGAPFRTALGRTFLDGPSQQAFPESPVVRVRAIPSAGVASGFRVVVGLSGDDTDALDSETGTRPYPALLPRPAAASPPRQASPPAARPVRPLRC